MTFLKALGSKDQSSWTVIAADTAHLRFASGGGSISGKPRLLGFGEAAAVTQDLSKLAKELRIPRSGQRAMLLAESDYRIHLVDAPNVAPAELKAAMKWRLKEIIDYPVDEATYDVLDLPGDRRGGTETHSVYAIAAKRAVLKSYVERFDKVHLPVSVIDIPETAQRNIATLYEEENRGIALLYIGEADGLLTVSAGGELYLARRLDISVAQIAKLPAENRGDLFNRILLELQRTLDNFERQFSFVVIGKLLLGPEPENTGLADYLIANLGIRVESVDLQSVMDLPEGTAGTALDAQAQWRYFHLIGCTLRGVQIPQ